jgi:hypothetical protein
MDFTDAQLLRLLEAEEDYSTEPPSVIESIERSLGIVFPALLKRVWGMGEEMKFISRGFGGQDVGGYLLALRTPHVEHISATILEIYELWKDQFPRVVPIASHLNGDYLVLDYRYHEDPTVLTYYHESGCAENPFHFAAQGFEELIDRGQQDREEFYQQKDAEVTLEMLSKDTGFPAGTTFEYLVRQHRGEAQ